MFFDKIYEDLKTKEISLWHSIS